MKVNTAPIKNLLSKAGLGTIYVGFIGTILYTVVSGLQEGDGNWSRCVLSLICVTVIAIFHRDYTLHLQHIDLSQNLTDQDPSKTDNVSKPPSSEPKSTTKT